MAKSEVERFIADLKEKEDLRNGLKETAGADLKSVQEFAKDKGYEFSEEDLNDHVEEQKAKLSEDDLDKVAGGAGTQEVVVGGVPAAVLDPTFVVTSQAQVQVGAVAAVQVTG